MKILVTGSSGMLGTAVIAHMAELGHQAIGIDVGSAEAATRVDISNWEALRAFPGLKGCDLVLHLAAATDVDQCEKDPDLAFRVNTLGTEFLARLCAESGAPLVYISTAAVFAGNRKGSPYTEFDDPSPINIYAQSKWRGEQAVRQAVERHFIVRAGWMMGGGAREKKFVGKITAQLFEGKRKLLAVSDKQGSLTYTVDFARNLMGLVSSGHYGTYHMANHGTCTRYEVAKKIVDYLGSDTVIEPVPSSFFPLPAPRPDSECLENYKLKLLGLDRMPPWEQSLRHYLKTLLPALKS